MKTAVISPSLSTAVVRGRCARLALTLAFALTGWIYIVPVAEAQTAEPCRSHRDYIRVGGEQTPYAVATGEVRSEADLSYTLTCPAIPGPGPVVVIYNAYTDDPDFVALGQLEELKQAGYAVLTVATRGAACSGGAFNPFHPDEARDGYDVIEWVAQQSWSNGKIAMMGESAAAITQLPVAALQPPSLDAIAPVNFVTDFYRDVVYPGGIYNQSMAAGWQGFQTAQSAVALALGSPYPPSAQVSEDTVGCPTRDPSLPAAAPQVLDPDYRSQKWDNDFYTRRLSVEDLGRIQVPVHAVVSWQDEMLSSRSVQLLSHAENVWAILTNGVHGTHPGVTKQDRMAFLNHFLKGEVNSFETTPRIKVLWETGSKASWTTTYSHWPAPQSKSQIFFLSDGVDQVEGTLTDEPGVGEPDSYSYDGSSGQNRAVWKRTATPGHSLTYTSPPLTKDLVVLGSASLDLWLASTAEDTDVQVTITDVRKASGGSAADTETFVQQGWLRASHRTLDPRSSETFPVHTHQEQDYQQLASGPNEMRIEILPFAHVFRAGSRVRVTIDAPSRVPSPWWSFDAVAGGATNTVFHSGDHLSRLVLSTIPGQPDGMPVSPPPCGSVLGQPCREI